MKKLISLLTSAALLGAAVPASAMLAIMPTITTDKAVITPESGEYYPGSPVILSANYDPGTVGIGEKTVLRLDTLPDDANLEDVVTQNADKLQYTDEVAEDVSSPSNSGRNYEFGVSLNGTYIFAGSSGKSDGLDTFSRVDVDEIAVERPMGYVAFNYDRVNPTRCYAEVKGLEAGSGAEIKRYALMNGKYNKELPPGSWPTTVAPEYRDDVYDDGIAGLYWDFQVNGMELVPGEDGRILLDNTENTYILFIEDTNGRYNALFFNMPPILTCVEPVITMEPENTAEPEKSIEPINTAEPLPFISDTLEVYEAPLDKQVYTVDESGKFEINISGKYIEPTPIPVTNIQLGYDSGYIDLKSPTEFTGKKLVVASYEDIDYIPEEDSVGTGSRMLGVKIFDVNTELVYPIEGNDSYCYYSAAFDISEFAYKTVRVMLFESLENPKPITDAEDVYVVWFGAAVPRLEVILGKKTENGLYRIVIWDEKSFDKDGLFSGNFEAEPGEYQLNIRTLSGDRYVSNFTVCVPE